MSSKKQNIAVIGAGVVGVSTAYMLARDGHSVTLIDAGSEPGTGASAANAAQLSWAYGDAMASPALLRHMPDILRGKDPAFRFNWRAEPDFLLWGLKFLLNSPQARWWANTAAILELAAKSRHELATLLGEIDLSFSYRVAGKLHLYPDRTSLDAARSTVARKCALGLDQKLIDREAAMEIEPALARYAGDIAGAIYTSNDAVGDAAAFCRSLTEHIRQQHGLTTVFGRKVTGFETDRNRLCAVRFADREPIEIDIAIAATGPGSSSLLAALPEARAINPVRGYSLTLPLPIEAPAVSLTDVKRKLAFATIGDRFRVAGLADIVAPGTGYQRERFDSLREAARSVLPHIFNNPEHEARWSGERPMTPSSRPIIAKSSRINGLFVNLGHGMLGWTLALGSARRLADLVSTS